MWVQIYTYKSADWSMILQSSLLLFYITSILWRFESHQVVLWSHSLSSWSYDLINFAFIDRFSENHVIFVILELSYSRTANDPLNLIRLTRQVALWQQDEDNVYRSRSFFAYLRFVLLSEIKHFNCTWFFLSQL